MKKNKSHFKFTKQERSGIFFLLLIIVVLQVGYFAYQFFAKHKDESLKLDASAQAQIDLLKTKKQAKDTLYLFPFNPNYITDYKGYSLGMSVEEIDRLHAFRAQNKFANSPEEFQKVTEVSDSVLKTIAPYFKFPEWTKKSEQYSVKSNQIKADRNISQDGERFGMKILDLNSATAEQLKSINGIGEKLSARIIKFRDRLGGFLVNEQLYDVYGLEAQVVEKALMQFQVLNPPIIEKINLNSASVEELQKLIYLQKITAKGIVNYRNDNGNIVSFDELIKIEEFPVDKIDRIILYLSLK